MRLLPICLAIVVLGVANPSYAALWYEDYESAEQALEAENWDLAIRLLEQAMEEKQQSGLRVRTYGMNFIEYFPYLKLGVAHYHLGNYDTALAWLEREETIGEVAQSPENLDQLQEIRRLAQEAREAAVAGERQQRVRQILTGAGALEREGRLEEAMAELGKAQAIDPENQEVDAALSRVQMAVAARQEREEQDARFARLLENGRTLIFAGRYAEAAAELQKAAMMRPDSEAPALLARAQSELATELAAERDAAERSTMITEALQRASELEEAGDFSEALRALQSVMALDPGNARASDMQKRLLLAQQEAERSASLDRLVEDLHRRIEQALADGDYELGLTLAQQALGRDMTNTKTMELLTRASQLYRRELLGPVGQGVLPPPLIAFFPDRRTLASEEDLSPKETTKSSSFTLTGNVFSNSTPTLEFFIGDEAADAVVGSSLSLQDGQFLTQFDFSQSLAAGLSILRVVATDADGRADSKEYEVLYVVPFYLRAWFYLALLAVAVAVPAAYVMRKRLQRKKLLKRRYNPYIAGAPVLQEDLFFGREQLLTQVLQSVHNNSILLYGERRIGKTSLQHHLMKRLQEMNDPEFDFYAVFIDLQGTPEEKFWATLAEDTFEELGPGLDGLQPNPKLTEGGDYDYKEFVRDIRAVLKKLKEKSEKRTKLVLLIDEVDELNDYDPRVNQKLRSLFMKSFAEDLVAVVSGVGIKKHWESEGSPWYNFFEEINVTPFSEEDAVRLIERPIRGVYELENGVSERIVAATNCRPYLIQKMCIALVSKLHEEGRRRITVADVEAVGPPMEA